MDPCETPRYAASHMDPYYSHLGNHGFAASVPSGNTSLTKQSKTRSMSTSTLAIGMEEITERLQSDLGQIKAKTEDEFLIKIGAKEEEIIWDPKIVNEKLHRSQSFVCPEYHKPAVYRARPKVVEVSAWSCDSQALRQLSLKPRFGPRKTFINNSNIYNIGTGYMMGAKTQSKGLCFHPRSVSSL